MSRSPNDSAVITVVSPITQNLNLGGGRHCPACTLARSLMVGQAGLGSKKQESDNEDNVPFCHAASSLPNEVDIEILGPRRRILLTQRSVSVIASQIRRHKTSGFLS
jgi:hypothetical protein